MILKTRNKKVNDIETTILSSALHSCFFSNLKILKGARKLFMPILYSGFTMIIFIVGTLT